MKINKQLKSKYQIVNSIFQCNIMTQDIDDLSFTPSVIKPSTNQKNKKFSFFQVGKDRAKSKLFDSFDDDEQIDFMQRKKSLNNDKNQQQKKQTEINQKNLFKLQQLLQKEYLMVSKQQFQKVKFVKQIQSQMKNYYTLLIQFNDKKSTKPTQQNPSTQQNKIIQDDGFDNCYDFIKYVVINTSKNYQIAITLLLNCTVGYDSIQDKGSIFFKDYKIIVDLFVNVFYQRLSQTDPFLKDITKLVAVLLAKLPQLKQQENQTLLKKSFILASKDKVQTKKQQLGISTNYEKIHFFFNQYMKKQQMQDYFSILSNQILKKVQKISFSRAKNRSGMTMNQSRSIVMDQQNSIQIPKSDISPFSSFNFIDQQNWLQYLRPFESFDDQKKALAVFFLTQIYSQADLCPIGLKIPLRYYYEALIGQITIKYKKLDKMEVKQIGCLRVWKLIERFYLQNFQQSNSQINNNLLRSLATQDKLILKDVITLVEHFLKSSPQAQFQSFKIQKYIKCIKYIVKVVQKLINVNDEKYNQFLQSIKQNNEKEQKKPEQKPKIVIQQKQSDSQSISKSSETASTKKSLKSLALSPQLIKIYGGCISLKQVQILLTSLKRIKEKIPSKTVANRVSRIFDMSPGLQFLSPKNLKNNIPLQKSFIIVTEMQYDPLIQDDYHKLYSKQYQSNKIKNIIRQILCELRLDELNKLIKKGSIVAKRKVNILEYQLGDIQMMKKEKKVQFQQNITKNYNILIPLLHKISYECSKSLEVPLEFNNLSIQLLKKIKYLLYIFQQKKQLDEASILSQMVNQVKQRIQKMNKLYEHTKFGLLAVIGNIKHYRNLLISKKQIEIKVKSRIRHIRALQNLSFSLCLTSPDSRNNPEFSDSPKRERLLSQDILPQQDLKRRSFKKQKSPSQKSRLQQLSSYRETFNKYKYRISNADEIILCDSGVCIHQENIFWGLNYHVHNVREFLDGFCRIKEVVQGLFFAENIISREMFQRIYKKISKNLKKSPLFHPYSSVFTHSKYQKLSFSANKINKAIYNFIQMVLQIMKQYTTNNHQLADQTKVIQDVIFRQIHLKLVKKNDKNVSVSEYNNRQKEKQVQAAKSKEKFYIIDSLTQKNSLTNQLINVELTQKLNIQETTQYKNFFDNSNINENRQTMALNSINLKENKINKKNEEERVNHSTQSGLQPGTDKAPSTFQSFNDQILLYQIRKLCHYSSFLSVQSHCKNIPNSNQQQQTYIYLKQIEQVCARFIRNINGKETPNEKIQALKSIVDIHKIIVEKAINSVQGKLATQYTLRKLIFKALLQAEPINFVTNLTFIQLFLPPEKLLSIEGKVLNQFKKVVNQIYQCQGIEQYFNHGNHQTPDIQGFLNNIDLYGQTKTTIQNIKRNIEKQKQTM